MFGNRVGRLVQWRCGRIRTHLCNGYRFDGTFSIATVTFRLVSIHNLCIHFNVSGLNTIYPASFSSAFDCIPTVSIRFHIAYMHMHAKTHCKLHTAPAHNFHCEQWTFTFRKCVPLSKQLFISSFVVHSFVQSLSLSLFVTPDQNIVPRSSPFVNVLDLPREEPPTTRTTIIQAQ